MALTLLGGGHQGLDGIGVLGVLELRDPCGHGEGEEVVPADRCGGQLRSRDLGRCGQVGLRHPGALPDLGLVHAQVE